MRTSLPLMINGTSSCSDLVSRNRRITFVPDFMRLIVDSSSVLIFVPFLYSQTTNVRTSLLIVLKPGSLKGSGICDLPFA